MEQNLFIHFGINTFTGREWGRGTENPARFNPRRIKPEQWVEVAREAGFKGIVFTAKHQDGFALWPTQYSDFSVERSPWKDGRGDVVRELAEACRKAGIKFGVYLSPLDLHEPSYRTHAYNDFYVGQLTELLTGYGPVFEVWLDGATDRTADHLFDFPRYHRTIRALQPDALIAIGGHDIRWSGSEDGFAPQPLWSAQNDTWWHPAECDVPDRPGWFWRASEDGRVKSLEQLLDIYYGSVGRNCVLLLNAPVDRHGLIPQRDAQRLREWRAVLDETFRENLAWAGAATGSNTRQENETWAAQNALDGKEATFWATDDSVRSAVLELDLRRTVRFNVVELKEPIRYGQRVAAYHVEAKVGGGWRRVSAGSTIGYKKLDRTDVVETDRVRVVISESRSNPALQEVGLYLSPR